jgi:hypothetical protein
LFTIFVFWQSQAVHENNEFFENISKTDNNGFPNVPDVLVATSRRQRRFGSVRMSDPDGDAGWYYRALFTIAPFILTNQINDFFVAYFFFVTGVCGSIYFSLCGFKIPDNRASVMKYDNKVKRTIQEHEDAIIEKEYNKRMSKANHLMMGLTIFAMTLGFTGYCYADDIFTGKDVTTLGASAMVLILANAQAWPHLIELLQNMPELLAIDDEDKRVHKFIKQLDMVVDFCSKLH